MPEFTETLTSIRDLATNLVAIPFIACLCLAVYGLLLRRSAR
jgi:hypothetical protein